MGSGRKEKSLTRGGGKGIRRGTLRLNRGVQCRWKGGLKDSTKVKDIIDNYFRSSLYRLIFTKLHIKRCEKVI